MKSSVCEWAFSKLEKLKESPQNREGRLLFLLLGGGGEGNGKSIFSYNVSYRKENSQHVTATSYSCHIAQKIRSCTPTKSHAQQKGTFSGQHRHKSRARSHYYSTSAMRLSLVPVLSVMPNYTKL